MKLNFNIIDKVKAIHIEKAIEYLSDLKSEDFYLINNVHLYGKDLNPQIISCLTTIKDLKSIELIKEYGTDMILRRQSGLDITILESEDLELFYQIKYLKDSKDLLLAIGILEENLPFEEYTYVNLERKVVIDFNNAISSDDLRDLSSFLEFEVKFIDVLIDVEYCISTIGESRKIKIEGLKTMIVDSKDIINYDKFMIIRDFENIKILNKTLEKKG